MNFGQTTASRGTNLHIALFIYISKKIVIVVVSNKYHVKFWLEWKQERILFDGGKLSNCFLPKRDGEQRMSKYLLEDWKYFLKLNFFHLINSSKKLTFGYAARSSSALQNEFGNIAKMFIASLTFIPKAVAYIPILWFNVNLFISCQCAHRVYLFETFFQISNSLRTSIFYRKVKSFIWFFLVQNFWELQFWFSKRRCFPEISRALKYFRNPRKFLTNYLSNFVLNSLPFSGVFVIQMLSVYA